MNLKIKDINSILVRSIDNIRNKIVSTSKKDNLLSKTSSR